MDAHPESRIRGRRRGERGRAEACRFDTPEGPKTLLENGLIGGCPQINPAADDDKAEYLVAVRWVHTVPREDAFSEVGLFGNQNTAGKPTTPKRAHTIDRIRRVWRVQ